MLLLIAGRLRNRCSFCAVAGVVFLRRVLGFQLCDQAFERVRDADGKLAGFEQRFERFNRRGIAAPAQRKDGRIANVERRFVQIGDQARGDVVILQVHAPERADRDAAQRGRLSRS